tara:strand:- start:963 stop:1349 length:387 start_codon:yes stop_codon:yes gene_type:complete
MKRNEFKLLIENWRKNFIVESPENPYSVQQTLDQDDLDYFASDYDDDLDQDSVETTDDMHTAIDFSDLDSDDSLGHGGHSFASLDTHSQESYGQYPEDKELDTSELDYDYSSLGDEPLPGVGNDDQGF